MKAYLFINLLLLSLASVIYVARPDIDVYEGVYLCGLDGFNEIKDHYYSRGVQAYGINTLEQCKINCQDAAPLCRGVDYNHNENTCEIHTLDSLYEETPQPQEGVSHYLLTDACPSACFPKWNVVEHSAGIGAKTLGTSRTGHNVTACLEYCLRTNRNCIGIVFQTEGDSSSCLYYEAGQEGDMQNHQEMAGATQYELQNRCHEACGTAFTKKPNTKIEVNEAYKAPVVRDGEECEKLCAISALCEAYVYKKSPFECYIGRTIIAGSEVEDEGYDAGVFDFVNCVES